MKSDGTDAAPASLEALLGDVATGNRAAFRALYDTASGQLFAVALRVCGDRAMAEDALQDAFTEIWRRAEQFDPARGEGMAWMAIVTRNRSIDLIRRRGRSPDLDAPSADEAFVAAIDPRAPPDGGVDYLALLACLGQLDDTPREAILLAYYRGMTREELAERFDAPVNTVKTWLRRGLARLRACLEA